MRLTMRLFAALRRTLKRYPPVAWVLTFVVYEFCKANYNAVLTSVGLNRLTLSVIGPIWTTLTQPYVITGLTVGAIAMVSAMAGALLIASLVRR